MTILSDTLRIAVLVNHPPNTTFYPEVQHAFVDSFAVVAPQAQIDFYDPIEKRAYPDQSKYDLIVLSGGKADASASDPWILEMLAFLRYTVQTAPRTKVLGICWGHQLIARAFGGHVAAVPTGPIARLFLNTVVSWITPC
jgi:putative intracellular protease/amidase